MNCVGKVLSTLSLFGTMVALADAPRYGGIYFKDAVEVDGVEYPAGSTIYAETWPTQMVAKPVVPAGKRFFCYSVGEARLDNTFPSQRYLQMDGTIHLTPPYAAGAVMTNTAIYTERVFWVDGGLDIGGNVIGSDETGDGTEERPFATIQRAVDESPTSVSVPNRETLILVKAGTYDRGEGRFMNSHTNRVVVLQNHKVLIRAVDGPDTTFIVGASDTTTLPDIQATTPGCGTNAMRCVAFENNCSSSALQGFTLTDGHSLNSTPYATTAYGGAVCAMSGGNIHQVQVLDCVITNCAAGDGGACYNVTAFRCRIVDVKSPRGILSACASASCLYLGASTVGSGGTGNPCIHNTGIFCSGGTTYYSYFCAGVTGWRPNTGYYYGSILNWGNTDGPMYGIVKTTSRFFLDLSALDFRIVAGSAADGGAVYPELDSADWNTMAAYYSAYAQSDVNGNRIVYAANGMPVSGAVQERVASDAVYVDAANGDDANDGLSPTRAKKSLSAAVARAQDIREVRVLAKPGRYDEGKTYHASGDGSGHTWSRVVVPEGLTLESEKGAAETFIVGDDSPTSDDYGCGPDAVRCVHLGKNATIRGFTLTGGRTSSSSGSPDGYGAAVYGGGAGDLTWHSVVEDCVISNNVGSVAAVYTVDLVNCRVTGNTGLGTSACAGKVVNLFGVLADDNVNVANISANWSASFSACNKICNCTFGTNTHNSAAILGACYSRSDASPCLLNSVFLAPASQYANQPVIATNCVFLSGYGNLPLGQNWPVKDASCVTTNSLEAIGLDETFTPIKGASLLLDAGGAAELAPELRNRDLYGNPRFLNGAPDIGAVEYDWRVDYTADIPKHEVVVTAADPQVIEREGQVTIDPGASLTAEWTPVGSSTRCGVTASVTGTGTLTVSADGRVVGTVTAADSPKTFSFTGIFGETSQIVFSYSQEIGDEGHAVIEKIGSQPGFIIILK